MEQQEGKEIILIEKFLSSLEEVTKEFKKNIDEMNTKISNLEKDFALFRTSVISNISQISETISREKASTVGLIDGEFDDLNKKIQAIKKDSNNHTEKLFENLKDQLNTISNNIENKENEIIKSIKG